MPRTVRVQSESRIYHIMMRGNERKEIFIDEDDNIRFLDTLYDKVVQKGCSIYAYCLMNNHVHLIINQNNTQISDIIKSLNISYAYYFNKKYQRVGHLFQDRFKSQPIDSDEYLLSAVRYVHKNPVAADIVTKEEDYRWSSYGIYTGKKDYKNLVDRNFILSMFSDNCEKAVQYFIKFSRKDDDVKHIEVLEGENRTDKYTYWSITQVKEYVDNYLDCKNTKLDDLKYKENKSIRDELIYYILNNSPLSIRQIADLLRINRGIVQRIQSSTSNKRVKEPSPDTLACKLKVTGV